MPDNDQTRISTHGGGTGEGKPIRARLCFERRMGRAVNGEQFNLLFGSQMLIGRDKAADITIVDDRISRKHALIRIDPDAVRVSDVGSTNGTRRNGEPVTEEIILQNGDRVCLGEARTFETRIVEREGIITSVRLASGNQGFLLAPREVLIGHASPPDPELDLMIYDPKLRPRHASIEFFTGQIFINTLDPARPVIVNSSPVRELELRNGFLIELGDTLLRFERD